MRVGAVLLSLVLSAARVGSAEADTPGHAASSAQINGAMQGLTSGVDVSGTDVTVNAGLIQGTGGGPPATTISSSSGVTCTSQAVDSGAATSLMVLSPATQMSMYGDPGRGTWYLVNCPGTTPSLVFVGGTQQPARPPLAQPSALAQQALATMHLPAPPVRMSPPSGAQVVNLADWLWIDPASWKPLSATATAGPVSATATATPERVVYDMGDGAEVVCVGPGIPYNPAIPDDRQTTTCNHSSPGAHRYAFLPPRSWPRRQRP